MQKFYSLLILIVLFQLTAFGQKPEDTEVWEPEPTIIEPGYSYASAPSDAIVLFSENHLDQWTNKDGEDAPWIVEGDHFTVKPGSGGIQTIEKFTDFQLHIEWMPPTVIQGEDRKSTRLNSSHVKISYAVFCLKKKKTTGAN